MFAVGDKIVYGRTGICEVAEVTKMKVEGAKEERLFYILVPVKNQRNKVFTPVDNQKVPIRQIISKEEAKVLLGRIPEIEELTVTNDKLREECYKACMRTCQCEDWIRMIKTIHNRKKQRIARGRKVTSTDERYLKQSESSLYSELSMVFDVPEKQVEAYIIDKIEN